MASYKPSPESEKTQKQPKKKDEGGIPSVLILLGGVIIAGVSVYLYNSLGKRKF